MSTESSLMEIVADFMKMRLMYDQMKNERDNYKKESDKLKADLARHQESEFHPDWSMLKATRESLREHAAALKTALAKSEQRKEALEAAREFTWNFVVGQTVDDLMDARRQMREALSEDAPMAPVLKSMHVKEFMETASKPKQIRTVGTWVEREALLEQEIQLLRAKSEQRKAALLIHKPEHASECPEKKVDYIDPDSVDPELCTCGVNRWWPRRVQWEEAMKDIVPCLSDSPAQPKVVPLPPYKPEDRVKFDEHMTQDEFFRREEVLKVENERLRACAYKDVSERDEQIEALGAELKKQEALAKQHYEDALALSREFEAAKAEVERLSKLATPSDALQARFAEREGVIARQNSAMQEVQRENAKLRETLQIVVNALRDWRNSDVGALEAAAALGVKPG